MRCGHSAFKLHGAYRRLSREITDLLDRGHELFRVETTDRHCRRRLLRIEPLEPRQFLSGDGLLPYVAPTWFQEISGGVNAASHAGAASLSTESVSSALPQASSGNSASCYDWIVQLNTAALQEISLVAQVSSLLVGGAWSST